MYVYILSTKVFSAAESHSRHLLGFSFSFSAAAAEDSLREPQRCPHLSLLSLLSVAWGLHKAHVPRGHREHGGGYPQPLLHHPHICSSLSFFPLLRLQLEVLH